MHRDPTKRLFATLLRQIGDFKNETAVVELAISQLLLSEMSNLPRRLVSGCPSQLEQDGFLETRYCRIAILDRIKIAAFPGD